VFSICCIQFRTDSDGLDYSTIAFGYDTVEKAFNDLQSIAQREGLTADELVVVQIICPQDVAR
jgi:hypothetical protein